MLTSRISINDDTTTKPTTRMSQFISFCENLSKRYLRLMPICVIYILITTNLVPLVSKHGPNSTISTWLVCTSCHNFNWFSNLFLLHNVISPPLMCLGHSWSIGVDFQLFILIQVLVIISNQIGCFFDRKTLLYATMFCAQIVVAYTVAISDHTPIPLSGSDSSDFVTSLYIKPHYWAFSYILGFILAIDLKSRSRLKLQYNNKNIRDNSLRFDNQQTKRYLMQFMGAAIIIYIQLSSIIYVKRDMYPIEAILYSFLARPAWSLVLYVLLREQMLIDNEKKWNYCDRLLASILRWPLWAPLTKLTLGACLLNPTLMAVLYGSYSGTFQFSHWLLASFALFNLSATLLLATIMYFLLELPINRAIRELNFDRKSRKQLHLHQDSKLCKNKQASEKPLRRFC